jgi:hypothetical protein
MGKENERFFHSESEGEKELGEGSLFLLFLFDKSPDPYGCYKDETPDSGEKEGFP